MKTLREKNKFFKRPLDKKAHWTFACEAYKHEKNYKNILKKEMIHMNKLQKMFEKFERLGYTQHQILDALGDYYDRTESFV